MKASAGCAAAPTVRYGGFGVLPNKQKPDDFLSRENRPVCRKGTTRHCLLQCICLWFKKSMQTIHYMPYFVSTVVIAGLVIEFVATKGSVTNFLVDVFSIKRENLLQNPSYFWWIYLATDIWQGLGYGSIFFVSAITSVSQELYEASAIDGAGRLRRVWHITLPGIMPAIITMLVLQCGMIMQVGGDKILLLYNASIYETADVISTHVQRMGIEKMQYGYSSAVGLFNSVIGTLLLFISNYASKKLTDNSVV